MPLKQRRGGFWRVSAKCVNERTRTDGCTMFELMMKIKVGNHT